MRDDLERRLGELGRAAEEAASPVGFDRIRLRAQRRRRTQTFAAVAVALVVATGVGVGVGVGGTGGSRHSVGPVSRHTVTPSPTPSPSPSVETPAPKPTRTAQEVVADPRSFVVASTVAPDDEQDAATLWALGPAGPKQQVALTTTSDGYQHMSYVDLPAKYRRDCNDVRAIGHHRFWLSCALEDLLVGSDGTVDVAKFTGNHPVPQNAVLVPAQSTGGGAGSNWFDSHGLLHGVQAPGSANLTHSPDGRIWGIGYGTHYGSQSLIWSTDGGLTWSQRALPGPPPSHTNNAYEIVPTAVPDQMVLARGAAETVFSPHSMLVFGSQGQQLQEDRLNTGHASMDSAVVTANGSLVMERYDEPHGSSGLFRGAPGHWADLIKVQDLPTDSEGRPAGSLWMGNSRDASGRPLVWAVFRSGVLATSTDDGRTWTTRTIR